MICRNEVAVTRYTITIRYSRQGLLYLKKTRTSGLLCRNVLFDAIRRENIHEETSNRSFSDAVGGSFDERMWEIEWVGGVRSRF